MSHRTQPDREEGGGDFSFGSEVFSGQGGCFMWTFYNLSLWEMGCLRYG